MQHRKVVIALADAQRNGLSGVPLLLLSFLEFFALPFLRRQVTRDLTHQVDAGQAAQTKGLQLVVDQIHAHLVSQTVKVDVGRADDGQAHVLGASAVRSGAAESAATKAVGQVVLDDHVGGAFATVQCCHRHQWLVGRAWRIGAPQRAVQQRFVNVFVQGGPAFGVDSVDKKIGVEGRFGHEGQHLAIARIDRNQSATAVTEHVFHQFLQLDVERQLHTVARGGRRTGELAHGAPAGRGLDPLYAGRAVQLLLKILLHAELAHIFGAAVVGLVFVVFDFGFFGLVDAPDIADDMACQFSIRVVAEQAGLDLHPRKAKALRCKTCHLGVGEACPDWQGLKALGLFHKFLETLAVTRGDLHHLAQFINGLLKPFGLAGGDLQRVRRIIAGQHYAVAVQDEPAVGHDRHDGGSVALSLCAQVVVAHHLQIKQAYGQQHEAQQHHDSDRKHAGAKARQVRFDVANFVHDRSDVGVMITTDDWRLDWERVIAVQAIRGGRPATAPLQPAAPATARNLGTCRR